MDPRPSLSMLPQSYAIRDPGVLSVGNSFSETYFDSRHAADRDISSVNEEAKVSTPKLHRHHHRRHRHNGRHHSTASESHGRRNSRRIHTTSGESVTPPAEIVQKILGEDAGTSGKAPKPLFSEMEELLWDNGDLSWKETARWIKFEEDVEESGNRFTKPHVGTLSLHSLFELRSLLIHGAVMFDVKGSTLDEISSTVVDQMIMSGNLSLEFCNQVKSIISKRHKHVFGGEKKRRTRTNSKMSFSETLSDPDMKSDTSLVSKGNTHFMKKIPPGAEASNILVGEADFLENPVAVFVRLDDAHELGDLTEVPVPTRFIFLLLGTVGNLAKYHEVGRAMGTLMSDEVFHELAYKANKREHLIAGIDEFLDSVTVLPPGEWDPNIRIEPPHHLPSQDERKYGGKALVVPTRVNEEKEELQLSEESELKRTGRIFGGLINDIKRKKPWYASDFKDSLSPQCIASWLFLYFGCLTPIVTFGGLLGDATKQRLASIESLVAGLVCGVGYGLFSGQPLTILGSTGPVLVFETILYEFCESVKWDYLSFRLWTGIWIGFILILFVAFDASAFVCYITRFTEENFAFLIALIFMVEAIDKLLQIQEKYPIHPPPDGMNCVCEPPANQSVREMHSWSTLSTNNCIIFGGIPSDGCSYEPNVFFMSAVLFILTVLITFKLKGFKEAPFFPTILRRSVSDFSVIISILSMTILDYLVEIKTPKLIVPATFAPTWPGRGWLIPILNGNPWWTTLAAVIPALLATILIFMDQQITAVIVNRRENKLKKGCGYHLDLFVVSILIIICSVLGLPFFVAATVLSVNHVSSLTLESETAAPGEKPKFLGVLEQRVTQLLIFTTIGISVFLVPLLKLIPMPVLYGIFLYMGAASLKGLQFVDRMLIMLMPSKYQPDLPYLRNVPIKRVHLFTFMQLSCLVLLWVIKSIKQTKMLFPIMLVVMIAIRKALDRYFTRQELVALDDMLSEFKRKEIIEVEKSIEKDSATEHNKADVQIVTKSGNIVRISVPLEFNITEEVQQCGVWKTVDSINRIDKLQRNARKSKYMEPPNASNTHEVEVNSITNVDNNNDDNNHNDDDDGNDDDYITVKIHNS